MPEITSEELDELDKLACEQHKLNRLIDYIKNPEYTVMWVCESGHHPLGNKVYNVDDELKVYCEGFREDYIGLYNINMEDMKIYKEINLRK